MSSIIEDILQASLKPKEKQAKIVEAVVSGVCPTAEFISLFESAKAVDQGTCADAMKHISAARPDILAPFSEILIRYINSPVPRVKWGIPETIGNIASQHPDKTTQAIPALLKNTTYETSNTTVVRWCAAFALGEIAKYNPSTRAQLIPIFEGLINSEHNNGVKNLYSKALKAINKELNKER